MQIMGLQSPIKNQLNKKAVRMHRAAFVFNHVRLTRKTREVGVKLQKI